MADGSGIEWTEATWNPTTGCDRISPGCDNCYALTLAKRLKAMRREALTPQTVIDPKRLLAAIAADRRRDVAVDVGRRDDLDLAVRRGG